VKYFAVKELVDNGDIKLEYVNSENNIADVLTKALTGSKFTALRDKLLGYT
jgi:hypothetical protein